jgi:chromosome segregation ATPase
MKKFLFISPAVLVNIFTLTEIRRLDSEYQRLENALVRDETAEHLLTVDMSNLPSQLKDLETLAASSGAARQARQTERETLLASIQRYRQEMRQEMTSVVDATERKELNKLRGEIAKSKSRYTILAEQLAEAECAKGRLETELEVDLVPQLAALTARLAAARNRSSQLGRLTALLAAQKEKRGSLQALAKELADREKELEENQRCLAAQLEADELSLKDMEKEQEQRMAERARLAVRESKLRRQLADMEQRYTDIGLVLPSSQIQETRKAKLQKSLDTVNQQLKDLGEVNQKALVAYSTLCTQREKLGALFNV